MNKQQAEYYLKRLRSQTPVSDNSSFSQIKPQSRNFMSGVSDFIAKKAPGFTSWLQTTMKKPVNLSKNQLNTLKGLEYASGKFLNASKSLPPYRLIDIATKGSFSKALDPYNKDSLLSKSLDGYTAPQEAPNKLWGGIGTAAELAPAISYALVGGSTFSKGKLASLPQPAQRIISTVLPNAGIGSAINTAFGGSPIEGAKQGILNMPTTMTIGHFTNPFISKITGNAYNQVASPLMKQIVSRGVSGALNVAEGKLMDIGLNQETTPTSVAIDLVSGILLVPDANQQLKNIMTKSIVDNNVDAFEQAVKVAKQSGVEIDEVKAEKVKQDLQLNKLNQQNSTGRTYDINKMTQESKKQFLKNQSIIKDLYYKYNNEKLPDDMIRVYWEVGKNSETDWRYGDLVGFEDWLGTTKHNKSDIHTKVVPKTSLELMSNGTYKEIPSLSNINKVGGDLKAQQTNAPIGKMEEPYKLDRSRTDKFLTKVKTYFENSLAPVDDVLNDYEIKTKSKLRPQDDFRIAADKVFNSTSIASQWAKDHGLEDIIRKGDSLGNLEEFNEYLIAKHAIEVGTDTRQDIKLEEGSLFPNMKVGEEVIRPAKETGRNLSNDAKIVSRLKNKYEPLAQEVYRYNKELLSLYRENGLISKDLENYLNKTFPNYVPFYRIFENEDILKQLNSQQVGSISQQNLIKKFIGSDAEIQSPLYSMFENTYKAMNDIERNRAAKIMSKYIGLEGNPFNIRELSQGESIGNKHTFSFLDNGIKRTFEVPEEIEAALKNLDSEQIGTALKIISIPTRILQMGATGLNVPFVVTNYIKDQQFSFITSNKAAQTSFVNPVNVAKGLYEAVGRGDLFEEVVREGGITSQFDIARGDVKKTLDSVASGKNLKSKIAYIAKNPTEILTSLENIVGTTEYATRVQQFKGTYDYYIKQGASDETARLFAGQAARENTANFRRSGTLGKYLNKIIPFFNAGIQGAKSLRRAFLKNPKGTSFKILTTVGLPAAVATINNLNSEEKKAVYNDIQEWEKDGNFIIVPDNPEKDEQGRWKVIKIPINPGLQGFSNIVRTFIEKGDALDSSFVPYVAKNLFGITTSLQIENPISQFTPQFIKPFVEYGTNKNLYTKENIVPSNMRFLEKEDQVYPWTSGTARVMGKVFNMSPIMVENLVSTVAGGLGKQTLNLSDNILNKVGIIPEKQVGGESVFENIVKRFTLASGGAEQDRVEKEAKKGMTQTEVATYDFLKSYKSKEDKNKMTTGEKEWFKIGENALRLSNPKVSEALRQEAMVKAFYNDEPQNPFNMLTDNQRKIVLTINSLPKGEDKSALQKENIEWLKPYWEANSNYFAYKAVKAYEDSGTIFEQSKQPIASEYVQKQMDLGNWKDPQVQAYLKANSEYKNYIRTSMGLPALEGYGGSSYNPMKYFRPKVKAVKMKKIRLKKLPKLKKAKRRTYKKIKTKKLTIKPIKRIKIKTPKSIGKIKVGY